MPFDPANYGNAIAKLLARARLPPLGPGQPDPAAQQQLSALTAESLSPTGKVADRAMAECCLAALWLHFDYLSESHALSQSIETREGSYWHAILHRREPDYDNAKYWFRRVRRHPIEDALAKTASDLARESGDISADWLALGNAWDAFRFVDFCQANERIEAPAHRLCREIQLAEWELLFDYCANRALRGE